MEKISQVHAEYGPWNETSVALCGRLGSILAVRCSSLTSGTVHQPQADAGVK